MHANHERMPIWNEVQIKRFNFRHGLFLRRGVEAAKAEALADMLAFRDFDRDDRRLCLECQHLQRSGKCFQVGQGAMPGVSPKHEPVTTILQRCHLFKFQTP